MTVGCTAAISDTNSSPQPTASPSGGEAAQAMIGSGPSPTIEGGAVTVTAQVRVTYNATDG